MQWSRVTFIHAGAGELAERHISFEIDRDFHDFMFQLQEAAWDRGVECVAVRVGSRLPEGAFSQVIPEGDVEDYLDLVEKDVEAGLSCVRP